MRTLSTRAMAALAYERGEEFDAAATPPPALLADLAAASAARAVVGEAGPYERRRRRERERRAAPARVPEWFCASDLVERPLAGLHGTVVHGEPV